MLIGGGDRHHSALARSTPIELLDTIERSRAKSVTIVGDAFAKPMLRALDAEPDRWDLSSLRVVLVERRDVVARRPRTGSAGTSPT